MSLSIELESNVKKLTYEIADKQKIRENDDISYNVINFSFENKCKCKLIHFKAIAKVLGVPNTILKFINSEKGTKFLKITLLLLTLLLGSFKRKE